MLPVCWPIPEEHDVEFISFLDGWLEVEAKLLDQQSGSLAVLALDGLTLVAGLFDGLIVEFHVVVLGFLCAAPIVVLEEGDVDAPLELRRGSGDNASGEGGE